ncbi:MAG: biopolymer transporter ExbD [Prevotella sp.]|nr:biopolymer transporter ExbD [Prevotella sp.]
MRFERRQKERRQPGLNMSSLPDLIFTVLFFFMIVTTMRSVPQKVRFQMPQGTELSKYKKQPNTLYLFIGKPVSKANGKEVDSIMVQAGDQFVSLENLPARITNMKSELLLDEQEDVTVMLKIDENVPMDMVTKVKQALRKAGALKVHYSARMKKTTSKEGEKTH